MQAKEMERQRLGTYFISTWMAGIAILPRQVDYNIGDNFTPAFFRIL